MSGIVEWYRDAVYNKNDPRTSDWFLVSSPGPLLMILVSYVYFCVSAGPRYMKDKKPYELRTVMIAYNFIQVLTSAYLVNEGLRAGWGGEYNFFCQPVDYSDNPMAIRMAKAVHFYFICKLIELLDTVFFVLRKKNRQISFLHLYHHTLMPICGWIGIRFFAGGQCTLLGVINSFVHVIMYTYYMLSSFGPHMHKYLWWKKYLTLLQLIQFSIVFCHITQVLFNGCDFPKFIAFLLSFNSLIFIYMFSSFYLQNYTNNEAKRKKEVKEAVSNVAAKNKSE